MKEMGNGQVPSIIALPNEAFVRARAQLELGFDVPEAWMSSFQYRELLPKSQVFEQETPTRVEEATNRGEQESDGTYHAMVLSHFACGRQRRMLLKSQADLILSNDNSYHDV